MGQMIAPPATTVDDAIAAFVARAEARAQIRIAGAVLAQRPRNQRKRWTGWLDRKTHLWRGFRVVTPERRLAEVVCALRGKVIVEVLDPNAIEGFERRMYRTDQLRPFRSPAAVLLGQQKRGVRERKSERKLAACRVNGRMPAKPGSRRRGRPPGTVAVMQSRTLSRP